MRFTLLMVVLALAVLGGLFIYGQMLQPETSIIEQEVDYGSNAS